MFIPDPNIFHRGSQFRIFSIADPGSQFFPGIPDPRSSSKARKYDSGGPSRILILIFYPPRISFPGSRGQKGTGSRIRIRNAAFLSHTRSSFTFTCSSVTHVLLSHTVTHVHQSRMSISHTCPSITHVTQSHKFFSPTCSSVPLETFVLQSHRSHIVYQSHILYSHTCRSATHIS
jgi:hypothetical protein